LTNKLKVHVHIDIEGKRDQDAKCEVLNINTKSKFYPQCC